MVLWVACWFILQLTHVDIKFDVTNSHIVIWMKYTEALPVSLLKALLKSQSPNLRSSVDLCAFIFRQAV